MMSIRQRNFFPLGFGHYAFIFTLIVGSAYSQHRWYKIYGGVGSECGFSVQQTTDGGYIVAGTTSSFGNSDQVYLIKTDSLGDSLWIKIYGGPLSDYGQSVQQTSDSGYIIAGYSNSFGNNNQVYLIKTDSLGDTLWTKTYGGSSEDYGYSVQQTIDGGYIIAGRTSSFGNDEQAYLVKTDPIGDTLWTKTYGGSGAQRGYSVQQTTDGGYIIAGTTQSSPHNINVLLVKFDSAGSNLWSFIYNIGWALFSGGQSVQQTSDSGYIITGGILIGSYSQVYLIKTDSLGNSEWENNFGGASDDGGISVKQTQDGGYIIAGVTNSFGNGSQVYLIKIDAYGGGSIKDKNLESVMQSSAVCPNPFSTFAMVIGHEKEQIILYDVSGRQVGCYPGKRVGLDLPAGVYFLKLMNHNFKPVRVVKVR